MPRACESHVPPFYDRAARVLLALPFIADAAARLMHPQRSIESLSGRGLAYPAALNYAVTAVELVGGGCLVLGLALYPIAILLAVLLVPATFLTYGLLLHEHPSMGLRMLRDLAIAGGLLLVAGLHRGDARHGIDSRQSSPPFERIPERPAGLDG